MSLYRVETTPQRAGRGGTTGCGEVGGSYNQWVCDTCGHRGIPLRASR